MAMRVPGHRSPDNESSGLLPLALAGLVVGALAGILGTAFHLALDAAGSARDWLLATGPEQGAFGWLVSGALAAAAAYVARLLVRRLAPETSGSGVQHVEAAIRGEAMPVNARALPTKFVGAVLAIGAGFALGREGPTVQMGATSAHLFASATGFDARDTRALMAAGAGAGLAAAFNAPLAGALFVFEELIAGFDLRVGVATLAACSAGLAVMRSIAGGQLVFAMPPVEVLLYPGYLTFLVFGALMGLVGVAYSRAVVGSLDLFERMPRVPVEVRAALVGALVGWLAWLAPEAIGSGDRQVQAVLDGGHTVKQLCLLLAVRFVLGPLSYAPGLPGGLFAPLLLIGALAGSLLGTLIEGLVPGMAVPPAAFAAVGMGALFVAVVRAPLTGVALAVEMTGATGIYIPLLTASAAAVVIPAAFGSLPIYDMLRARDRAAGPNA